MKSEKNNLNMRDVATAAGVSIAAVSRTLNGKRDQVAEKTMEKVFAACENLGYQLNPGIQDLIRKGRTGKNHNLGFTIVGRDWSWSPYAESVEGVGQVINRFGYNLSLAHLSGKEKSIYEFPPVLRDGRCDGFLLTGELDSRIVDLFRELGKPLVIIGFYDEITTGGVANVRTNVSWAAHELIKELKKAGRTRIAHFVENPDNYFSDFFLNSCLETMRGYFLEQDESLIYKGKGYAQGAIEILHDVILQPELPFNSIVCQNYRCAQELSYLLGIRLGRYGRNEVLVATSKSSELDRLPVASVYYNESMRLAACTGVELLITPKDSSQSINAKIEITPEIVFERGKGTKP